MESTTGPAPNPSARKVAISRVRAETALYIVFSAPKIAPSAIIAAMKKPIVRINPVSMAD